MKPDSFFSIDPGPMPQTAMAQALLFHRTSNFGPNNYYGQTEFVASLHDIKPDSDNQSVIGAGRLLNKDDIEVMLKMMLDMKPAKPFLIPSNVLSYSDKHIVWWIKGCVRPMLFKFPGKPVITLNVPWPNLLLLATAEGRLSAFALRSSRRPSGKTPLFNAPVMNVGQSGAVCTGSADLPASCAIRELPAWENVMFDTAFSHVNNGQTLKLANKGKAVDTNRHFKFWKDLSKKGVMGFPAEHLVPNSHTLNSFMAGAFR